MSVPFPGRSLWITVSLLITIVVACKPAATGSAKDDAGPRLTGSALGTSSGSLLAPTAAPGPLQRPPHPAMATSSHGLAALEALAAAAGPAAAADGLGPGLTMLASGTDGAEKQARDVLARTWKVSADGVAKVEAAAGVMMALVLDPDPQGYTERLTDAYGMSLYVTAIKGSESHLSEAARALVLAASGRERDAMEYATRLAAGDVKDEWTRLMEGLARAYLGRRGEAVEALNAAVESGRAGPRVYLERGKIRWQLLDSEGALKDAEVAVARNGKCTACRLLKAQAEALSTDRAVVDRAMQELAKLSGDASISSWWRIDALVTAAVVDARRGQGAAVDTVARELAGMKNAVPEAALVAGLAALANGKSAEALTSLDRAVRGLPPGPFRSEGLWGLARAAVQEKAFARAEEALRALEQDGGATPETATLTAEIAKLQNTQGASDDLLRAYTLDPYSEATAKAAGKKPLAGGAAASAKIRHVWRLIGGGAPKSALAIVKEMTTAEPKNPYVAWAAVAANQAMDAQLPPGKQPSGETAKAAVAFMKVLGKRQAYELFPVAIRLEVVKALNLGDRAMTMDGLKALAKDPDPKVARSAAEAASHEAPQPREQGHQ